YSQGEDEDNHHWLPLHDFPNDRATWSCTLHVPKDLVAVSNGKLLGVADDPGGATRAFRFAMEQPNVTYLISVAIGPWERFADEWHGVPVEYFVERGTGEARARRSFGKTPEMIDFFSTWIGVPYAWPKYAQTTVQEFVVGGMENVSATTQTDLTLHDERTHLERDSDGLVSHELAHQWWGDLLTCDGWRHLWLNEGFATYFTALWLEHEKGLDDYRLSMDGNHRGFLASDPIDAPLPLVTTPYVRRGEGASHHVYTKGASVLHLLRFVLGDDDFRRAISTFAQRHAGQLVETRDLERAVADATGRGLEWFWTEWVYLSGAPSFEVASRYDEEKRAAVVTVKQTQAPSATVPVFRTPVDLLFGFADGSKEVRRIWIEKADQSFELPFASRPTFLRFDEGSWIPCRLKHERTVDELAAQATADPDVVGRREAAERLGEKDDPKAVAALAALLASRDHREVRVAAAGALRKRKGDASKSALLAALNDGDAVVRRAAADSLAVFEKDADVRTALERTIAGDVAYGPRASAVRSLGAVAGADAWDAVTAACDATSERDSIRIAALETLRKIDGRRAMPALLAAAKAGVPYDARGAALAQLASIAGDEKLGKELRPEDRAAMREAFVAASTSNSWRLRVPAIRHLGALDDAEVAPVLDAIAKSSHDRRDVGAAEASARARKERAERKAAKPAGAP
ncbi:MAG TPA: M1 family aminopeptidase, partial [Planctomycetota bacterium]|nr:M1 family aminopeptidase [Planctomycetota bacterium]